MAIEFKPDQKALAGLRAMPEVVALIEDATRQWSEDANATLAEGEGYNYAVHKGTSDRGPYVVGRVWTRTTHAKRSNAKHQTLARIVGK